MCAALGRLDLEKDPRFDSIGTRATNQDELISIIEAWLQDFDADQDALDLLEANRVPSGPVLSPLDALEHDYFEGRGTIRKIHDPILGDMKLPSFPLRFSGQSDYPGGVAPLLGEHNEAILSEILHLDSVDIKKLTDSGLLMSDER